MERGLELKSNVREAGRQRAIYLIKHRARPHRREFALQFVGAAA
jgi:hypothetical protein